MRLIARAVLRRRWASLVALGLLMGLTGAVVTAAMCLARRTGTAYERLEAATAPGDVTMFVFAGEEAAERVVELPGVADAWIARGGVAAVAGTTQYFGILAGGTPPPGLFRPIVVSGRMPAADAPNEVVVNEQLAREIPGGAARLVGSRFRLRFLTDEDFRSFDTGFEEPHGPEVEVTVVGVVRMAGRAEASFSVIASRAFAPAYSDALLSASSVYVKLRGGDAGLPLFLESLDELAADVPGPGGGAEEFGAFDVELTRDARREVDATAGTLATGLMLFAALAGAVGLFVVVQAFARYHATIASEQQVESALGLTRAQRATARAWAAFVPAALAAAITFGGAVIAGSGDPIGAIARYEPNPGRSVNAAVVALGVGIAACAVVAIAWVSAWAHGRLRRADRRSRRTGRLDRLGGRPVALGLRFGLGASSGDAARPIRVGLSALMIGVSGIVTAGVFDASLARLVDTPGRYGWSGDFVIADSRPDIDHDLVADRRVGAVTRYRASTSRVEGRDGTVALISLEHLRGDAGWWIVDGTEPHSDDEATLGLRLADDLGVGVGSTIRVRAPNGSRSHRVTVVGVGVETPVGDSAFGTTMLVNPAGLERFAETEPFAQTLVRAAVGADPDALADDYERSYEITRQAPPREVSNLEELRGLPELLGGFFAMVGLAALADALLVAVRRRARDLAVLRVIGYTPNQIHTAVLVMGLVSAGVALIVGIPVGVVVARPLWQLVAEGASVEGDILVPGLRTVAIAVGVVFTALLVAMLAARRAARLQPGMLLRSE